MAMARPGNTPSQRGQVHVGLCRPVQHAAPGRHVRRHTDAQETQCRLGNDRDAQKRCDNHNVECQAVGNHIAENDARVAGADRLGRQDIVHLFDGERLGTQDPGSTGNEGDAEGDDDVVQRRAQRGHDRDGQNERREGHQGIDDSLDDQVRHAAEMDAGHANHHADAGADECAEQASIERNPRAVHEPAEHVTAYLIAAQPVLRSGRRKDQGGVGRIRVVRGNQRGEYGNDDEKDGDHGPEGAQWLLPGKPDDVLPDGADRQDAAHRQQLRRRCNAGTVLRHFLSFMRLADY